MQSLEELRHLLVCASVELESVRAAAEAQSHIYEAEVRQLEELVHAARQERDAARQQCFHLQEALSQSGALDLNYVNMLSSRLSSGSADKHTSKPMTLIQEENIQQNFHQDQLCDNICLENQLQQHLEQQHEKNQFVLVGECGTLQLQIQQQNDSMLVRQALGINAFNKDENQDENNSEHKITFSAPMNMQSEVFGLGNSQMMQSWQIPCSEGNPANGARDASLSVGSNVLPLGQGSSSFHLPINASGLVQTYGNNSVLHSGYLDPAQSQTSSATAVSCFSTKGICSAAMTGELSSLAYSTGSGIPDRTSVSSIMLDCVEASSKNFQDQPIHLPEPPEANLHVMLNSLPEKGKLLQAVMQAGPLLQTLLLAGPLPQWRHPPPAIDSLDIPKISTLPSTSIMVSSEDQITATGLTTVSSSDMRMLNGWQR